MKRLYLFDFDGTLTHKDTMFDFLQYSFPKSYTSSFIQFIPIFLLTKFKIIKAEKAKKKFISHFLKGKSKSELDLLSNNYFEYRKESIFRKRALSYVKDLAHEEDKYIVTASLDIWVKPFAKYLGVRLISTQAEFKNDIFTGNFSTPNCNYKQKVNRIVEEIQLSQFGEIYAFGDTDGDKSMLKVSTNPHFKYFE